VAGQTVNGSTGATEMALGDETAYALPGGVTLKSMVADLPYAEMLAVLQDHMRELEQDLPELTYSRLPEFGTQLSGRAIKFLLSAAVARAVEVRGNLEAGLVRADMMALTIGATLGIEGFSDLGTFDSGKLDHSFETRPIIATDPFEDAQTEMAEVAAKQAKHDLGVPTVEVLIELGYDKATAERFVAEKEAEAEAMGAQMLQAFDAGRVPVESQNGNGRR
jgi:hypothetical protein